MTAHLMNTGNGAFPVNRMAQMFLAHSYPFLQRRRGQALPCAYIMPDLVKHPWITDSCPADHDAIHSIPVLVFECFFRRINIPIAEYRDMNATIVLHFPDECPVGLAFIHLRSCASMYTEGF